MTERSTRESLLLPVLIPVGVLVGIVTALYLFSRVLLRVTHTAATITALIVAFSVLTISAVVVGRQRVTGASLFSMFGGILGVAMLASGLALLLGQPEAEQEAVVLDLAAGRHASVDGYAETELSAPSGTPFEIAFANQETGVQHNVDLATDDPAKGGSILAETQVITGPATATYRYEALDPGTYYYFCKIHPTVMFGSLTVAEGLAPGGPPPITVVADGLAFDTETIDLPADAPSQIDFENHDAGTEHNIAIYRDDAATDALFEGEIIIGPSSTMYQVGPIPAGTYYFRCDVHHEMNGTVDVRGGPGDGGGGGGEGGGGGPPTASPSEPPP